VVFDFLLVVVFNCVVVVVEFDGLDVVLVVVDWLDGVFVGYYVFYVIWVDLLWCMG